MKQLYRKALTAILCVGLLLGSIGLIGLSDSISNEFHAAENTVVDCTGLAAGAETSHDCTRYLQTKYDSSEHWQECFICGGVYGPKTAHSFTTTGTYGCASYYGYQYNSCSCGYSYSLPKKEHIIDTTMIYSLWCYARHTFLCAGCGTQIHRGDFNCRDSSGNLIGCRGVSGTCATCGQYKHQLQHGLTYNTVTSQTNNGTYIDYAGILYCYDCNAYMGTYDARVSRISTSKSKIAFHYTLTAEHDDQGNYGLITDCSGYHLTGTTYTTELSYEMSDGSYYVEGTVDYTDSTATQKIGNVCLHGYSTLFSGYLGGVHINVEVPIDWDAPMISGTPTIAYSHYVGGYATKGILSCVYNEIRGNNVWVRVLDSDQSTAISDWKAATASGDTFYSSFDIYDEVLNSKTIYVQAKDEFDNVSVLTPLTLQNFDSK